MSEPLAPANRLAIGGPKDGEALPMGIAYAWAVPVRRSLRPGYDVVMYRPVRFVAGNWQYALALIEGSPEPETLDVIDRLIEHPDPVQFRIGTRRPDAPVFPC
jgi:hypothetical protein